MNICPKCGTPWTEHGTGCPFKSSTFAPVARSTTLSDLERRVEALEAWRENLSDLCDNRIVTLSSLCEAIQYQPAPPQPEPQENARMRSEIASLLALVEQLAGALEDFGIPTERAVQDALAAAAAVMGKKGERG